MATPNAISARFNREDRERIRLALTYGPVAASSRTRQSPEILIGRGDKLQHLLPGEPGEGNNSASQKAEHRVHLREMRGTPSGMAGRRGKNETSDIVDCLDGSLAHD